ncbi:MAG: MurR/RpiR family transcriptional regulator, partial [Acetobacteraceae bacterium]
VFGSFVQAAVQSLLRIEDALDRDQLAACVDVLAATEVVHVAAARGAFGLGAYTVYGLGSIGRRAHLIDNIGAMRAMQVAAMAPDDTLLAMTFDDYTPETVEVVKLAAQRGSRVLVITDNALSPVSSFATHILYVNEARLGHFRSQVPAMVVAQAMIVGLGRRLASVETAQIQKNENFIASTRDLAKDGRGRTS